MSIFPNIANNVFLYIYCEKDTYYIYSIGKNANYLENLHNLRMFYDHGSFMEVCFIKCLHILPENIISDALLKTLRL